MGWNTKPKQQSFWTKPQHALNIYGQTPTDKLTKLPSVVGAPKPQMQRLGLGGTVYPSNQPGFGKVFEGYMPAQPSAPPKVPMAPVKQFALGPASSFEKNLGAPPTLEDVQRNIRAINQKPAQPDDLLSKYQNDYGDKPLSREALEGMEAFNRHLQEINQKPPVQGPVRPPFDMEAFKAGDPRTVLQGMDNNLRSIAEKRKEAGWAGITDDDLAARRKREKEAFPAFDVPPLPTQEHQSAPAGIGKFGRTGPTFRRGKSGISASELGGMEQQLGIPQGMREPQPPPLSMAQAPQDPSKEYKFWSRGPNGEMIGPQQAAAAPVVAPRPAPAGNAYAGMTPDETVNAMRREMTTNPLDALRGQVAAQAGVGQPYAPYTPMTPEELEAGRRRAASLGGNTGPEDAAKAIGPGLDNSAWYMPERGAGFKGAPAAPLQAPQGDIARSRFQGAMTYQDPVTGRAKFIDPRRGPEVDQEAYNQARDKAGITTYQKPLAGQDQTSALREYAKKRAEKNLSVQKRFSPNKGMPPVPPGGDAAAIAATTPQAPPMKISPQRYEAARQEAEARRGRLAARKAGPNPLDALAANDPETARMLMQGNIAARLGGMQGDREAALAKLQIDAAKALAESSGKNEADKAREDRIAQAAAADTQAIYDAVANNTYPGTWEDAKAEIAAIQQRGGLAPDAPAAPPTSQSGAAQKRKINPGVALQRAEQFLGPEGINKIAELGKNNGWDNNDLASIAAGAGKDLVTSAGPGWALKGIGEYTNSGFASRTNAIADGLEGIITTNGLNDAQIDDAVAILRQNLSPDFIAQLGSEETTAGPLGIGPRVNMSRNRQLLNHLLNGGRYSQFKFDPALEKASQTKNKPKPIVEPIGNPMQPSTGFLKFMPR